MRALTIKQPWASLIASGRKRVENRLWPTNYRGLLAIHSALDPAPFNQVPDEFHDLIDSRRSPRGAIIAVAELVDCVELHLPGKHDWLRTDPFAAGPWCWILGQVRPVAPIYCRGHQRLWTPSQEQIAQLRMAPAVNLAPDHDLQ